MKVAFFTPLFSMFQSAKKGGIQADMTVDNHVVQGSGLAAACRIKS
jgi:hypothetical protein